MDGVIESTGMTVQARNSYIPSEFQWQHKFKPMLATITSSGVCEFDLNFFHETEEVPLIGITYAPYKKLRRVDNQNFLNHLRPCYTKDYGAANDEKARWAI
jgi:hypothetical protein